MIRTGLTFPKGLVDDFRRFSIQRLERAALVATDRASKDALKDVRASFAGSDLGRYSKAIGQFSDLTKGKVFRRGKEAFSASGGLAIKTKNERTVGAIKSYTEGAEILPVKGRYLWFATDEIPKRAGRMKMTPELYRAKGFESKIGPLIFVPNINGRPLLVVKNASVNEAGKARSAKSRKKGGGLRKGQRAKEFIVAFIGIPRTRREQRVDVEAIMRTHAARVGEMVNNELQKGI